MRSEFYLASLDAFKVEANGRKITPLNLRARTLKLPFFLIEKDCPYLGVVQRDR